MLVIVYKRYSMPFLNQRSFRRSTVPGPDRDYFLLSRVIVYKPDLEEFGEWEDRMKTAVIVGCGAMADGWLSAIGKNSAIANRLNVVGFVDLDARAARALADKYAPSAAVGTDLSVMLADTKPDMVFDIVVPAARLKVVTLAFAAGCDVLSEKPMGGTLEEAHQLLAQAKASGKLHAIIQNRRYLKGIRRAKAFIDSGVLGQITEVHCDFFIAPHFGGFRDEMQHVLLHDMAIHTFDAARYLASLRPQDVYCRESNPVGSWYRHGASASAIFGCAGGEILTYRGSWAAEGCPTNWEAQWRIIGSRGTLIWDGNDDFRAEIVEKNEGFLRPHKQVDVPDIDETAFLEGHAGVISDFLDAVETRVPPLTAALDNIQSLAMTFAAIDSAETARLVEISI